MKMIPLSDTNIAEFQEKGYTILINALNEDELSILHEEADILTNHLISEGYDLVKDLGCIIEPLNCGFLDDPPNNQYKVDADEYSKIRNSILIWENTSHRATITTDIILNQYGRIWASQLLKSDDVYLLNEQFIIKPPSTFGSSQFAWHKDSDYYHDQRHREENTLACWTALDAVNEINGTVEFIDYLGQSKVFTAPAGSILFMSNKLLHKSTGNSNRTCFRRAYMPQYSTRPIIDYSKSGLSLCEQCVGLAIPCGGIKKKAAVKISHT